MSFTQKSENIFKKFLKLGNEFMEMNDYENAIFNFNKVIKKFPKTLIKQKLFLGALLR